MSVNIKRNGTLQKIADQTILFDADCAEVRTGTYSIECMSDSGANATITFSTPMPDNDYIVIFKQESPAAGEIGFRTCTTTGFNLFVLGGRYGTAAEAMTFTGTYYAFKLVELDGYTSIYNKILNSIDSSPTQNSTNFVTSGGVYEAIANSASSFIGTQEEWENLSVAQKSQYEIVYITDDEAAEFQYSTSEQWTGKRWIDGKKIYTIAVTGAFPSEITNGVPAIDRTILGVQNIDQILKVNGWCYTPTHEKISCPRFWGNIDETGAVIIHLVSVAVQHNGNEWGLESCTTRETMAGGTTGAIIEYTKTTD